MKTIFEGKSGDTFGLMSILNYFGCILLPAMAGSNGSVFFFNKLLHGPEKRKITRPDMPRCEAFIGMAESYLPFRRPEAGTDISSIYNYSLKIQ